MAAWEGAMPAPRAKSLQEQNMIASVLASAALFRGATPAQVAALAKLCRTLKGPRNDVIAARGAEPAGVGVLAYGTVKISLRHAERSERVLRLVQAGQTFGEAAVLLGRPNPYEVRALSDYQIVMVPAAAIYQLVDSDPRAARQILHSLAARALDLLAELESTSLQRGDQRLASYLVSLAGGPASNARLRNAALTVHLPATKTVIASRLDMKKETLSRLLRSLSDLGLIEVEQADITLLDPQRLAEIGS
jgi:CRP-like cAMP-binding protein